MSKKHLENVICVQYSTSEKKQREHHTCVKQHEDE